MTRGKDFAGRLAALAAGIGAYLKISLCEMNDGQTNLNRREQVFRYGTTIPPLDALSSLSSTFRSTY